MITQPVVYKTSDGKIFEDEGEARKHELKYLIEQQCLELFRKSKLFNHHALINGERYRDMHYITIASVITKHHAYIKKIIEKSYKKAYQQGVKHGNQE